MHRNKQQINEKEIKKETPLEIKSSTWVGESKLVLSAFYDASCYSDYSEDVVMAPSVKVFESRLNKFWINQTTMPPTQWSGHRGQRPASSYIRWWWRWWCDFDKNKNKQFDTELTWIFIIMFVYFYYVIHNKTTVAAGTKMY